jgi:ABC-2 type transport system permease protein
MRDWRSLTLALAIPLLLILLYGYALTLDLRKVPTVVWDQGTAREPGTAQPLSVRPISSVDRPRQLRRTCSKDLDQGRAMVALVIPGDFAAKVQAAKPVRSRSSATAAMPTPRGWR